MKSNNEEQFQKKQKKIRALLSEASKSQYYNKILTELDCDFSSYEQFQKIPVTTKSIFIQYQLENFIDGYFTDEEKQAIINHSNNYKRILADKQIDEVNTSGTTGQPLNIFRNSTDIHSDYFYLMNRRRKVTDIKTLTSSKYLWLWPMNQNFVEEPIEDNGFLYTKIDQYGYRYPFCSYQTQEMKKVLDFILYKDIRWMTGQPSALSYLSKLILESGSKDKFHLSYIECHSEKLFEWQKSIIEEAFGVVPVSVYASNETSFIGYSCSNNYLHILDNCFVEIVNCSEKTGFGDVLVTKLNNKYSHLIRYQIGDKGRWVECECEHKKYAAIELAGYRSVDVMYDETGHCCEPFPMIDQAALIEKKYSVKFLQQQIIQRDKKNIEFNYKVPNELDSQVLNNIALELVRKVREYLGSDMNVVLNCGPDVVIQHEDGKKFKVYMNCSES